MAHRGVPDRSGPWWQAGRTLLFVLIAAGVFTALFIIGDLLLYGRVNW